MQSTDNATDNIYVQTREEAQVVWFLGVHQAVRAVAEQTRGAYSLFEQILPPGVGMPLHIHHNEDETIIVLEGTLTVWVGDQHITASKGGLVYAPRDIAHAFRNDGDVAVVVQLLANPSGFEGFIFGAAEKSSTIPPDMEKVVRVAKQYGVDILGGYPDSAS
jgi:quercetin dioxygenase-like cupin family protein